ncbi:MAG: hypothetical protein FJ405_09775 [Verrucomicrobia bacterium]|nr:hypothetical protein [Verrucomicrobiota bacterium]
MLIRLLVLVLFAMSIPATGKAASRDQRAPSVPWAVPPYIFEFAGPMRMLFGTNTGFGVRVSVRETLEVKGVKPATGTLLFRDGLTLFEADSAPIEAPRARKKSQKGDFGFMVIGRKEAGLCIISEGVSGFTELPGSFGSDAGAVIERQEVGRERVEGYDCIKSVVAVSNPGGEAQSFIVWTAPKLRGFPLKIERRMGGPLFVFTFSQVRFDRPDESLFLPPEKGYKRYPSVHDLTEEMTRRVWDVIPGAGGLRALPPDRSVTRPGYAPIY